MLRGVSVNFMKAIFAKIKKFLNNSLIRKFIVFNFSIIFISLTFSVIYFYSSISSILIDNSMNELIQNIADINKNVESQFSIADNALMLVLSNKNIQENLNTSFKNNNLYLETKIKSNIEDELKAEMRFNFAWDTKLVNALYIIEDNGLQNTYSVKRNFIDTIFNKNFSKIISSINQGNPDKVILPPNNENQTLFFIRNVNSSDIPDLNYKIVLEINEVVLANAFNSLNKYSKAEGFIVDQNGIIVSHNNKKMLGLKADPIFLGLNNTTQTKKLNINGVTYISSSKKLEDNNLTSIIVLPEKFILSPLRKSMMSYLLVLCFFGVITLFIGIGFSSKITKPLKGLVANISSLGQGNFNTKMPAYNEYELNEVSLTFNHMTDKINELFNEIYQKQLLLKEAELSSLQAQINPHFLFNTLLCIAWESKLSGNESVYQMITSLSQLLRANIYLTGKEKITIKQEFEYINYYLFLQKKRFTDRFEFEIANIDDTINACYLPKLIIQSVVENAVIHGLENKIGNGTLKISFIKDDNSLFFIIEDNGVGFDVNLVNSYIHKITNDTKAGSPHIGLYNINKRITLLYGNEYGLSIESIINKGSKITIHIPIDKEG